jgi:acetyltransferase-like isoleucine patch superfamily enzyme
MKHRISILFSWFVRMLTIFLPNLPVFMRFRGRLYSLMMKKCGKDFQVASSVMINSLSGLEVGKHVYIAHNTVIIGKMIHIGNEVLIGPNCVISAGNHQFKDQSFRFGASLQQRVKIGNGAWVAGNCSIVSGAYLPDQSILAAGSVLTKTYSEKQMIYGGVPAKSIKSIYNINNT